VAAFIGTVQARDDGRYSLSPLKPWFDGLRSGKGPCCSDADGFALSDPDWESKSGHYLVRVDNEWIDVPDDAVITEPNRAGSTRGFAAKSEPGVAVCLLPGTELAFERDIRYNRNWLSTRSTGFSVARFCAIEPDGPHQHHDALSFPDGKAVLVNVFSEGQHARVLQLPVIPRESVDGHAEKTVIKAVDPELTA
jgi:hypothetical protein